MNRRRAALVIALVLGPGTLVSLPPAQAARFCVTHDVPEARATGGACLDTNDPNLLSCGGRIRNIEYICA